MLIVFSLAAFKKKRERRKAGREDRRERKYLGMLIHTCNPNTEEMKVGRL